MRQDMVHRRGAEDTKKKMLFHALRVFVVES